MKSRLLRSVLLAAGLLAALSAPAAVLIYPGATPHSTGGTFGKSTADLISLYNATPIVQPSGAAQTALTDNTGGDTSAATLAAGVGIYNLVLPIDNASIANGDIVVAYVPGHKFKLLKVTYVTSKPVTTGAKLSTITPKITGVAVTGGVLSLTSATMTPVGTLVAGTAVTALNTGGATDSITLTASATTAFVEGSGSFVLELQNMDQADAAARTAVLLNKLRADLVALGAIKGSS